MIDKDTLSVQGLPFTNNLIKESINWSRFSHAQVLSTTDLQSDQHLAGQSKDEPMWTARKHAAYPQVIPGGKPGLVYYLIAVINEYHSLSYI